MGLATVIRLEFAYPGVGVLAGDSLQYLSTATAHGVIMVFFMIMPLIFGAFGNFLLPTQLGVHDVAFPRLNSAAFWFLPGGLIMLCQLVCVDRRYQRMNCFNIRELQGILKRRFFTDLVNSNDFRQLMDVSMVGLRFKSNQNLAATPNSFAFYNFGVTASSKNKAYLLDNVSLSSSGRAFLLQDSLSSRLTNYFNAHLSQGYWALFSGVVQLPSGQPTPVSSLVNLKNFSLSSSALAWCENLSVLIVEAFYLVAQVFTSSLLSFHFVIFKLRDTLLSNLDVSLNSFYFPSANSAATGGNIAQSGSVSTSSDNINYVPGASTASSAESSDSFRFTRFNNPLIHYDYKCGNYLGMWDKLYPSLMLSFIEVARGIRKASWFFADPFTELLKNNFENFNFKFLDHNKLNLAGVDNWYSSHVAPTESFFTAFTAFNGSEGYRTLR